MNIPNPTCPHDVVVWSLTLSSLCFAYCFCDSDSGNDSVSDVVTVQFFVLSLYLQR